MSNTLITDDIIAKEALRVLRNKMQVGALVNRQFKKEFVKVGDTVRVRKPVKFLALDSVNGARTNQDVTEQYTNVVINKRKHVSWNFSTQDLTLKIEEYSARYIAPAMNVLADAVDLDGLAEAANVYNAVGTPGTTPASFAVFGNAATKLDDECAPSDMRSTVLSPAANWSMADALKALPKESMSEDLVRKGALGRIAGSMMYASQNVAKITTGARGGTPAINGASQTGDTLAVDGWSNSVTNVVRAGDVFTIAGVYAVNPVNKAVSSVLRQFVVTAAANSTGGGAIAAMAISPAITTSGPYQNVSAGPADDALLTFLGTAATAYPANIMFHRDAFTLVTVPLELPRGAAYKARATYEGLSVRVINDYDIDNDVDIIRLDIMYGWKTIYPELACRIFG